ncbi:DUF4118 domain-containing protein [Corynebacterium aquilae]|uniref:histidine kinase n=1 Tax=Corynebacterium aquilae DSM 44791 TaxID=1431546 RepID=A0A1L7CIA8_9CORY|nr:DUF4118 domain-containing protein [Corynebacterium aquilae]APT85584.1 histidine kinase [Corynebacterium aquilae DSM 44791]
MTRRGTLKVYLGFAPGVGKTYAMLQEAHELTKRGHDVLVGLVEDHGRARTKALTEGLEILPRIVVEHKGAQFEEMDLAAVLERAPEFVLVDELAHTIVGAGQVDADDENPHTKRWQDVYTLLDAGINVISTLNIQHLESLNDVVAAVTTTRQRETVPDQVLRDADDVVLVDLSPDALRIRLSRGEIYQPDRAEAALSNYFRLGNLTALRELSLLWLADKVDEGLEKYRQDQEITDSWQTRERIVVAVTGRPDSEILIRRGARIAGRKASRELIVVHIAEDDGLASRAPETLSNLQKLTEDLDGEWRVLLGGDVVETLIDFATNVSASQLIIGTSGGNRLTLSGRISRKIIDRAGKGIDVHIVSMGKQDSHLSFKGLPNTNFPTPRRVAGWLVAIAGPLALTGAVQLLNPSEDYLAPILLGYLTIAVFSTLLAGVWPALAAVIVGSLLANWFFTDPVHTFTMSDPENVAALVLFLVIALAVAWVVSAAERRGREARRAQAQAVVLADLASGVLREGDDVPALLRRLESTFGLDRVDVQRYSTGRKKWFPLYSSKGHQVLAEPTPGGDTSRIALGENLRLTLWGVTPSPSQLAIIEAHGARITAMLAREDVDAMRRATAALQAGNRVGSALLTAVSHDLRTPLAGIKAAVSSLTLDDVELSPKMQRDLIEMIEQSTDRLDTVVGNLLDMSRLNSNAVTVARTAMNVDELVDAVRREIPEAASHVTVDIPESLPQVSGDPGLTQRILANLLINARTYAPHSDIHLVAGSVQDCVEIRVIDHGPGISEEQLADLFTPFQHLTDSGKHGLGLGLAVSHGFAEAMDGALTYEQTPGGGATFVLTLRNADGTPPSGRILKPVKEKKESAQ